jgi:hypothetical protein
VQVVDAPELTLVGLQASAETRVGATKLTVAVWEEPPLRLEITVADWFVVMVPAVAMKVAELAPADTVTDVGTVSTALLSDTVTATGEETASLKLTVQLVEAPEAKVPGLQLSDATLSGNAVIVPPVAVV